MPIYAYKCSACGHAQDVLQKLSDPLLTVCPACGKSTYVKQVTAAGFQLKGSGWYVTDFRDKGKKAADGAGSGEPHHGDAGSNGLPAADTKPAADAAAAPAKPAEPSASTSHSTE